MALLICLLDSLYHVCLDKTINKRSQRENSIWFTWIYPFFLGQFNTLVTIFGVSTWFFHLFFIRNWFILFFFVQVAHRNSNTEIRAQSLKRPFFKRIVETSVKKKKWNVTWHAFNECSCATQSRIYLNHQSSIWLFLHWAKKLTNTHRVSPSFRMFRIS